MSSDYSETNMFLPLMYHEKLKELKTRNQKNFPWLWNAFKNAELVHFDELAMYQVEMKEDITVGHLKDILHSFMYMTDFPKSSIFRCEPAYQQNEILCKGLKFDFFLTFSTDYKRY